MHSPVLKGSGDSLPRFPHAAASVERRGARELDVQWPMSATPKTTAESHTAQWLEAALRAAALASKRRAAVPTPGGSPGTLRRQLTGVEAILAAFRPACAHVATAIPSSDSCWGGLQRHHEEGVLVAERAPSGDDGGAYLYLLANGRLAELAQWPIRMNGADGWVGRLTAISLRRALSTYPELCPDGLTRTLTLAFGGWLMRRSTE